MMLASCENCLFRQASGCELGLRPDEGELLCKKYTMTVGFREELLKLMRQDLQREISRVTLAVQVRQMEDSVAFAG